VEDNVQDLLKKLTLDRLGDDLYRGESQDIGGRHVFGGQVLGQALFAASQTVEGSEAHSLHAYFLRPGDMKIPIDYEVERIRDGRSYATRRIVAIQRNRPIFNMSASFQKKEEGIEHQFEMPKVPDPEELPSMAELAKQSLAEFPEKLNRYLQWQKPVEFRPVQPSHPLHPEPNSPFQDIWIRANGVVPANQTMHKVLLAYASDFSLLGTALLPHALTFAQGSIRAASLDHAMWFHCDFCVDDWLLYSMDSPNMSHGRGFSRGNIFARDGKLVASVTQEGMIRKL
jgi:acyl-CoA thioesterase-2